MKSFNFTILVFIFFLAILSLCGCMTPATIQVQYHSLTAPSPISGAGRVKVYVQVTDGRINNSRQVGNLNPAGDYREKKTAIFSAQPVPEIVQQAIVEELRKRGFQIGPSRTTVMAEVNKFYSDYKQNFLDSAAVVGEVRLAVQARGPDSDILYTRTLTGQTRHANVQTALEAALASAISDLMSDQAFIQAVLDARRGRAARTPKS